MAWVRFRKKEMPGGLWTQCPGCSEMIYSKDLQENLRVCPKCSHHMTATVDDRIAFHFDEKSFTEVFKNLKAVDRLEFKEKSAYKDKLVESAKKAKRKEAVAIGTAKIHGREVVAAIMDFKFLGGSMGVVVGEKITIAVEMALERGVPLIVISASGGARMHEGALSLMQMAKTCSALARLDAAGGLYISLLTNPTTGGVTASFATMADVIIAEPGALIGFAGPRVIQNTIKQELPEGFQRSEFLLEKGQIDRIIVRSELKDTIFQLIEHLRPSDPSTARPLQELIADAEGGVDSNGSSGNKAKAESSPEISRIPLDSEDRDASPPPKADRST